MALAQLVTQTPGTLIKSGDWNNEFQNILTHPIALVSPTTGAINFNLQAHTNLIPAAISATSGSAGNFLSIVGGVAAWAAAAAASPAAFTTMSSGDTLIGTSSGAATSLAIGSTGQVLAVTSSNTRPSWGVIPISGGLTSGTVSTGTLFYVSSSGVLTPLAIGTTGQVLTVVSSLPAWTSSGLGASASGGSIWSTGTTQIGDDFLGLVTESSFVHALGGLVYIMTSSGAAAQSLAINSQAPGGTARVNMANAGTWGLGTTDNIMAVPFWTTLNPDMSINVAGPISGGNGVLRWGLTTGVNAVAPSNGVYWQTSGSGSTWIAVCRNAGTTFTIVTTAIATSSAFQMLRIQITSSATGGNVYTNGVLAGTAFTSSQIPSGQPFGFTMGNSAGETADIDLWTISMNRNYGQSTA